MENKKIKVCLLTPAYPLSKGDPYSCFVHEFAKALSKGSEVKVVSSSGPNQTGESEIEGIKIKRFNYFFPRKLQKLSYFPGGIPEQIKKKKFAKLQVPLFLLSFFFKAYKESKDCDIIDSHWALSGFIGYLVKLLRRKPLIITIRENDPKIATSNFLFRLAIRKADAIITNNDNYVNVIMNETGRKNKVIKIHRGTSERFKPMNKEECRKKLSLPKGKIGIFVGSMIKRKGPDLIVDSLIKIFKDNDDLFFIFIGGGVLKDPLYKKVKEHGYEKRCLFIGKTNFEEIPIWLNASDFFVLPTKADGTPNVIKEAMSCGLPVISTNVGGVPDIMRNKENGFLIEYGDLDALTRSISEIIQGNTTKKMGEVALSTIKEGEYNWNSCSQSYLKLYHSLLK